MGMRAWIKRIVCNKRKKENKPKQLEARKPEGVSNFQSLFEADALTKQASSALDKIQFWSKIQLEIRTRRLCMVTESRIKQKKLQNDLKLESKFHELEVEWSSGPETMEEMVSKIQQREEATNKRERAMAYAFSHQWRVNSNRYFGQAYCNITKESWGWSWMERWVAVCPWEARAVTRPDGSIRVGQLNKPGKKTMLITVKPQEEKGKGTTKATNGTS